ncbi:MAG: MFS transporter [Pyrinomonadaceae bacterium MAG19_C2-C3]|nr:MFS transporter [Pyrinomonadaceae bacterium MAG19_C2-C3]
MNNPESTAEQVADVQPVPSYSWYVLAVLTAVYVLNFLDRQLIFILFPPIKAELQLTDFQLALLGTTSFVIFYTLLGIPFGRLADRVSRTRMIATGLAVWSLFSGLTGFAEGFWTIFLCRVMVGVGEATLGPAALSLLSDYFPPRMRATVSAVYSSGIAVGGGIAYFLGGWIGATYGWRWAFYLLGFPGLLMAVVVFMLREVQRGRTEVTHRTHANRDWRVLFQSSALRYHLLGYAVFAMATYSLGIWGFSFFVRVHQIDLATLGFLAGVLSIAAGLPGTILGGVAADKLKRRYGAGGRMRFTALGSLLSIPFWLVLLFSNNMPLLIVANFVLLGVALMWLGPAAADVHDIAGVHLRGLAIGVYFFTVNIVGYGIAPPLIGKLNDILGVATNPEAMRYALLVCPAACLISALLLFQGSRAMARKET